MNKKYSFNVLCAVLFLSAVLACPVISQAQDADSVKQRMESRIGSVNALKTKGIIGENNKGFLAFVGASKEGAEVVNAENADRLSVYTAIAKKRGTAAEQVGVLRAVKLAEMAKAGEYVQNDKGAWIKK